MTFLLTVSRLPRIGLLSWIDWLKGQGINSHSAFGMFT